MTLTVPVVEDLPSPSSARAFQKLVLLANPGGGPAEAIRGLRTRLQASHLRVGRRALAICGPTPEVGNTFMAVNLAIAMSQIGIKSLLVDADLRMPSVQEYFDQRDTSAGLYDCLAHGVSMIDACQADVLPNLDVLFAGRADPEGAQELLASGLFMDTINACLRDYDVTIVDTPAASGCSDSRLIGSVVGFSLVVARKNYSLVSDVQTLASELRRAKSAVVGSVLNIF